MTTDELNQQQIDTLLDQIDTQRVEVERRTHGRLHHDTHIASMMQNRRSTDRGYEVGHGRPWEFEDIAQDAVLPVVLGDVGVAP